VVDKKKRKRVNDFSGKKKGPLAIGQVVVFEKAKGSWGDLPSRREGNSTSLRATKRGSDFWEKTGSRSNPWGLQGGEEWSKKKGQLWSGFSNRGGSAARRAKKKPRTSSPAILKDRKGKRGSRSVILSGGKKGKRGARGKAVTQGASMTTHRPVNINEKGGRGHASR